MQIIMIQKNERTTLARLEIKEHLAPIFKTYIKENCEILLYSD